MLAVTDCRLPADLRDSLSRRGFEVLPLPPFPLLSPGVASHPDMLMFILCGSLVTHKDYYSIAKREIERICLAGNYKLILSDEAVGAKYPSDILFNAAPVGKFIFAKKNKISRHILKIADENGLNIIDVRQGYARCSAVAVGSRAVITADAGIASAALGHGIDVFRARPGYIRLDGFGTGFIGGASGKCGGNVYFCGNIDTHPDGAAMRAFCAAHLYEAVSLGDGELFDAGTIFFV
jgi:hypothetical protein